ncbi:uncharacterized protein Tco025E_09835, partial [Trypanosoma conorhini]
GGRGGVSGNMGPKYETLRPLPKTLIGGPPNSSTEQWRAATRLRCRRWSAWRSSTPAPPASSLAFPSGPLGRLLKRRLAFSRWRALRRCGVSSAICSSACAVASYSDTPRLFSRLQPDTLGPPPDSGKVAQAWVPLARTIAAEPLDAANARLPWHFAAGRIGRRCRSGGEMQGMHAAGGVEGACPPLHAQCADGPVELGVRSGYAARLF